MNIWVVSSGDSPDENEHAVIGAYSTRELAERAAGDPELGHGLYRSIQPMVLDRPAEEGEEPVRLTLRW